MSKKKQDGNLYDRIFKENAEAIFLPLIQERLNLKIKQYKELPTKLSKTLEREMDFVYEIIKENNQKEILHIEFQTVNDKSMKYRIGEYHALLLTKYKVPIQHVVIYLGKSKINMQKELKEGEIYKGFSLINLHQLNSQELLNSQIPEVIILALLTHTKKEKLEATLRLIVQQLKRLELNNGVILKKYLDQLTILARMRKFEEETKKILEEMIIQYDIEEDYFYKQGIEKGIEKGKEEGLIEGEYNKAYNVVLKCFKMNLPIKDASFLSGLSIKEVQSIYDNLNSLK